MIILNLLIFWIGVQVADWLAVSASARLLEWSLSNSVLLRVQLAPDIDSQISLCRTNAFLSALSVLAYMVQVYNMLADN